VKVFGVMTIVAPPMGLPTRLTMVSGMVSILRLRSFDAKIWEGIGLKKKALPPVAPGRTLR
jgi:hypothetical protein